MAVKFTSNAYMTFDLSDKLFVGGDDAWFDVSIYVKYTMQQNFVSGEPGPFSFASTSGNEYAGIILNNADGLSRLWNRWTGKIHTATTTGDIQQDGIFHSWLWSYRERVGLDSALYINSYHDGETDIVESDSTGTGNVAIIDNFFRMAVGLSDYGGTIGGQMDCAVDEVAVWSTLINGAASTAMYKHGQSPLTIDPYALLHYTKFHGEHARDLITGKIWVTGSGSPTPFGNVNIATPTAYGVIKPYALANQKYSYLRRLGKVPTAPVGGLSIPVAMHHYTKNIGAA